MKRIIQILLSIFICLNLAQCDSTTAEEYKAQAIRYAESGERAKAIDAYIKAADKGNSEAQFIVGILYQVGDAIPNNTVNKDIDKSISYLENALNDDIYMAAYFLGKIYECENEYLSKPRAAKCYEVAYNRGSLSAGLALATLYIFNGEFGEYDYGIQLNRDVSEAISQNGLNPQDEKSIIDYDILKSIGLLRL